MPLACLSRGEIATMRRKVWVYDPHSGGTKIPPAVRERTAERIQKYAQAKYAGKFTKLDIRFRGALCYIDAFTEPDEPDEAMLKITGETRAQYRERLANNPLHLCRIRYFGDENSWSLAFYTYSNERYEPSFFENGTDHGTPEEAFDVGAVYLLDQ
jgi:hypothetical protein